MIEDRKYGGGSVKVQRPTTKRAKEMNRDNSESNGLPRERN